MLICANCKREMRCTHNGIQCRWHGSHIYAGDMFECPECGNKTVHCNSRPFHSDKMTNNEEDIYMDNYYQDHVASAKSHLNFRRKTNA